MTASKQFPKKSALKAQAFVASQDGSTDSALESNPAKRFRIQTTETKFAEKRRNAKPATLSEFLESRLVEEEDEIFPAIEDYEVDLDEIDYQFNDLAEGNLFLNA